MNIVRDNEGRFFLTMYYDNSIIRNAAGEWSIKPGNACGNVADFQEIDASVASLILTKAQIEECATKPVYFGRYDKLKTVDSGVPADMPKPKTGPFKPNVTRIDDKDGAVHYEMHLFEENTGRCLMNSVISSENVEFEGVGAVFNIPSTSVLESWKALKECDGFSRKDSVPAANGYFVITDKSLEERQVEDRIVVFRCNLKSVMLYERGGDGMCKVVADFCEVIMSIYKNGKWSLC